MFLTGIPIAIMIIPVFQMFGYFGLLSLIPTGVFLGVTSLPFALWLIKTAMDSVPKELEEAAQIERAGVLQIILYVTAPLALPEIAAAAIFSFISAPLGAFLVPLVLISDANELPGPILIYGQISAFFANSLRRYCGLLDRLLAAGGGALHPDVAAIRRRLPDERRRQGLTSSSRTCPLSALNRRWRVRQRAAARSINSMY